jgi:hypothetical protein
MSSEEPRKMIFLGALVVEAGQTIAIDVPPNASVEAIQAAIERANLERAEAAKRESERLHEMFLNKLAVEK